MFTYTEEMYFKLGTRGKFSCMIISVAKTAIRTLLPKVKFYDISRVRDYK